MDRLPADDLLWVYSDDLGSPMDTGAVVILEGRSLHDSQGRFRLESARRSIEQRLHLAPRFRQVLYRPRFGLGTPLWIDAQEFDVADHVKTHRLVPSIGEQRLLQVCEQLRRRRLDPSKPLWEMWFITGLDEGHVAVFIRLHHAVADGIAGLAVLAAFLDLDPYESPAPHQDWSPAPVPSRSELLRDNIRRRVAGLRRRLSHISHPVLALRGFRSAWPFVHEVFAEPAPRTSLNRRVGPSRKFALIRGSLDAYRRAADVHGCKVNDVLLSAVGGGLRDLLINRGESVDDLVLRAMVPISLHQDDVARANLTSGMAVPIPMGEPDAIRRVELIAAETAELKKKPRPTLGLIFRSSIAQKALLRVFRRQRLVNLYVTNLPGPPVPLYLMGAEILEVFPIVPTAGNITLGIGALSYAGRFNITATADGERSPDLQVFLRGFQRTLDDLAVPVRGAPSLTLP